jgi:hypothetical protein
VTPRWRGPSLLEARARALAVEEVAVAGRCGAAHERGSLQLRPKARLVVELKELALLYGPSDGLLLQ